MATKAGRIQLKDIKQGRIFYQVLADFNIDGTPKVLHVKPIFVKSRPQGMRFLARRPAEKHHNEFAAEFRQWRDISVDLRRHFLIMQSPEILDKGIYNPIFINKRTADRFVKQFMLRHATLGEVKRVREREYMNTHCIGPRGHISDFDMMRPLSFMPEPSPEVIAQWNAAFEKTDQPGLTEEEKKEVFKVADELTNGAFSKVLMAGGIESTPPQYDWEGLRETMRQFRGDRPHVIISATMPLNPPALHGYGEGIRRYADMIFNPVSPVSPNPCNGTWEIIRGKERTSVSVSSSPEVETHFYKGDQLKVIDNKDGDELCEGGPVIGEIMTMMDRSSEYRSHIIVKRENGRELQLEKRRFELHQRGGSQGVITHLSNEDEGLFDVAGNRIPDFIFDSCSTIAPLNIYGDEKSYKPFPDINQIPEDGLLAVVPTPIESNWNVDIDGTALICCSHGQMSEEEYTKIRMRSENGLTDEECKAMITAAQAKPGRPFRSSEMY